MHNGLIVDEAALLKKGGHSVGVAPHYASALDTTANCQSLVFLTLASARGPGDGGLRMFLPEEWTCDPGEQKYYASNFPADALLATHAGAIKARWNRNSKPRRWKP